MAQYGTRRFYIRIRNGWLLTLHGAAQVAIDKAVGALVEVTPSPVADADATDQSVLPGAEASEGKAGSKDTAPTRDWVQVEVEVDRQAPPRSIQDAAERKPAI